MEKKQNNYLAASKLLLAGLENIPGGLFVFNENQQAVYANKYSSHLSSSLIKDELKSFFKSPEPSAIFEKNIQEKIVLEIILNKIYSADKVKTTGVIAVIRDITETKKTDTLKSDFIYLIAHELKTPLTAITGPVALLLSKAAGTINENQTRFLQIIKKNAERLARLLGNLSDLARIESGKIVLKKESGQISEAVKNCLDESALLLKEKNLQIKLNIPASLPAVMFDHEKIEQVLINLITNAVKFSPDNSEITIAAEKLSADGGDFLAVSLTDQGIGVSSENLIKIFDKFFQAETPQKGLGTGLGLTIAHYIVEAHGGKIWAESPVNPDTSKGNLKGSKFTFTLPL